MDWPKMIKQARLRLGESQAQFARRFAVATNTVSRWETGTYQVSLEAVEWLFNYSMRKDMRVCPRCGGCGLVNEATQVTGLVSTDSDEAERPSNPPNNHKE